MAKLKRVYFLLILLFCSIFFFVNDFGIVEIQKTAIVLGMGIDRDEEGFSITAQLAVPQKSKESSSTSSVEVTGKGKTVGEALTTINATTGWYPKLTFCDLIVVGESAVEQEVFAGLEYFLRNENVSDYVLVATCKGSAKEFFSSKTPTTDMSTLAAEKILSNEAKRSGVVLPMTLREFAISYYTERGGYLPLIVKKEQEKGGAENPEENAPEGKNLFDATKTALFYKGQKKGELSPVQTLTLGILENDIRIAAFPVEESSIKYTLGIRHAGTSFDVTEKDDRMKIKLCLKAKAVMLDSDISHTVTDVAKTEYVDRAILSKAEEELTKQIVSLISSARETKCDLFNVKNIVHKKFPRFDTGERFFDLVDFSVSVVLQNL